MDRNYMGIAGAKVSVVIPCYNGEKYLRQCLDSIVGQTLKELEIICVNDGSTDSTLSIFHEYAAKDSRFRIIDKPNGGYGESMNRALDAATGEYLGIVESDDFVEPDMFNKLFLNAKEHDADIVKSNYYMYKGIDQTNTFYETLSGKTYDTVTSSKEDPRIVITQPCIWSGIYRKRMLEENHIRMNETPGASYQDTGFSFKVLACAERVVFVKDAYLHYRIDNEGSSVKSAGKVFSICDEFMAIQSFLNEDKEKRKQFSGVLQVLKLDSYEWNLSRIAPEFKKSFRDQMALEFMKAEYDGFLRESDFDEDRWKRVRKCIEQYQNPPAEKRLATIENSTSFRIGRAITWLPRKIKGS